MKKPTEEDLAEEDEPAEDEVDYSDVGLLL